jgi:hypothetical protein
MLFTDASEVERGQGSGGGGKGSETAERRDEKEAKA